MRGKALSLLGLMRRARAIEPGEMSTGNAVRGGKAKLLLLKMSLTEADVLVLDEPTRNFSPLSGPEVRGILKQFTGAIISISHDRKYIREVCDKVYLITENGLVPQDKDQF